jgi:hypothetical protein
VAVAVAAAAVVAVAAAAVVAVEEVAAGAESRDFAHKSDNSLSMIDLYYEIQEVDRWKN